MSFTALQPEDVARLHADAHAGYELVSYGEIGLPYFEIKLQAQILDHKPVDPFAEFVLRASASGIRDSNEMQQLLGLNPRVLETTVVGLIAKDLLRLAPDAEEVWITP